MRVPIFECIIVDRQLSVHFASNICAKLISEVGGVVATKRSPAGHSVVARHRSRRFKMRVNDVVCTMKLSLLSRSGAPFFFSWCQLECVESSWARTFVCPFGFGGSSSTLVLWSPSFAVTAGLCGNKIHRSGHPHTHQETKPNECITFETL